MKSIFFSFSNTALLLAGIFFAFSPPAHAYVDAGTGSYALQVAVASLFGALFSVKLFWANIKQFLSDLFHGKDSLKRSSQDAK